MSPRKTHWTGTAWVTRREYDQQQQMDHAEHFQHDKPLNETTVDASPSDYRDCICDLLGSKHISSKTRRILTFCETHQSYGGMPENRLQATIKARDSGIKARDGVIEPRDSGTNNPPLARPVPGPGATPARPKPGDGGTDNPPLARPVQEPTTVPQRRRGRPLGWRKATHQKPKTETINDHSKAEPRKLAPGSQANTLAKTPANTSRPVAYNRHTVASDILRAVGRHPTEPPLNSMALNHAYVQYEHYGKANIFSAVRQDGGPVLWTQDAELLRMSENRRGPPTGYFGGE